MANIVQRPFSTSVNTALWVALAASLCVERAVLILNVGDINNQNRTWWGGRLNIWLDYPQSVIAGIIAFDFFKGGMPGYIAGTVLIAIPLKIKRYREYRLSENIVIINLQQPIPTDINDELILLADRCMNTVAIVFGTAVAFRDCWKF